jgi:DNA-binding Lrp family transcriptional regulator
LNAPLYVDASTGKLRPDTVAFMETTASRALEDMEKAGELSGYSAVIDPEQNVLATSELEVIIKQVAVGVMRRVLIKIGYATAIN